MKIATLMILAGLAAGCGKKDEGGEKAGEQAGAPRKNHECRIIIGPAGEPPVFRGSGPTEEAAWAAVCAELPEARRGDCRDGDQFSAQTATMTMNDQPTFNVQLTEKRPSHEARATSTESTDAACQQARLDACKAAAAEGDCVASGAFQETGRMASTQTAM